MALANDYEIIHSPPSIMVNSRISKGPRPILAHRTLAEFRILQPDNTLHAFQLPVKSTGQDCIDKICGILGIVEKDYFGLQYKEKTCGHMIWINNRNQVRKQINHLEVKKWILPRPPYLLHFSVKYYTPPSNILQSSTIDAFVVELKSQIRKGNIHVPSSKKGLVGAHIAQAEEGDYMDTVYPPYFSSWNSGIAHIIKKEHQKMKGVKKRDAQVYFIQTVYELESYGVTYVKAVLGKEDIILGIGAKYVRIYKNDRRLIYRVSIGNLVRISIKNKSLFFTHCIYDGRSTWMEMEVTVSVHSYMLARSLYRSIVEDHEFYYKDTVSHAILNDADNSEILWKTFCKKVFKKDCAIKYYYDICRTRREAYKYYWQILNQVTSTEPPEEPPVICANLPNNNQWPVEEEEEEDAEKLQKKCEVYWGLSDSTVNIAKLLLPPEYINTHTELSLNGTEPNAVDECTSNFDNVPKPLSEAQGKKMFHFLTKIQNEKLCSVCVDELISTVFCPCGHYVACQRCAKMLDKCPVCRQPIGYAQYVYTK